MGHFGTLMRLYGSASSYSDFSIRTLLGSINKKAEIVFFLLCIIL